MSSQDLDVMYVQNPALGTVLLWRFTCGYYSNENRPVPFPLLFVVLPIVFRQDLCSVIKSTQKASGLSKVSEKLFSGKLNDSMHSEPLPLKRSLSAKKSKDYLKSQSDIGEILNRSKSLLKDGGRK